MLTEDQTAAVAILLNPAMHRDANKVEMIETHISRVLLVGDRAFKMKRAVKLPYGYFSTADLRLAVCKLEVKRNSTAAPGLYLGTRTPDDQLEFDGPGELVDAVVEMRRFDQSALLDRMALAGELTPKLMKDVARTIIQFHRGAPASHSGTGNAETGSI